MIGQGHMLWLWNIICIKQWLKKKKSRAACTQSKVIQIWLILGGPCWLSIYYLDAYHTNSDSSFINKASQYLFLKM